jgi:hypothetical protein
MFLLGVHIQLATPTCFYLSSDTLLLLARSSSLMSSLLFWHIFILTFKQVPEILKSWINLIRLLYDTQGNINSCLRQPAVSAV